jgi:hypothetical protein
MIELLVSKLMILHASSLKHTGNTIFVNYNEICLLNKRPMGHITHLSNLDPYRNILF